LEASHTEPSEAQKGKRERLTIHHPIWRDLKKKLRRKKKKRETHLP